MSEAFDTLKASQALKSAGCEPTLADAVVSQIKAAVSGEVATKLDIERLGLRIDGLDSRMDSLETSLSSRMDSLETSLSSRMDSLETSLTSRMDSIEAKMGSLESGLTSRMDSLEVKMDSKIDALRAEFNAKGSEFNARLDRQQIILVRWMLALFGAFFVLTQVADRLLG